MVASPASGKALMDYFVKACPTAPKFNRAIEKWAARDLVESYGLETCKQAVDWYSRVTTFATWKDFVVKSDSCVTAMTRHSRDIEERKRLRKIANEWRMS